MHIAFYESQLEATPLIDVLDGSAASSGSIASLAVLKHVAQYYRVTAFHRFEGEPTSAIDGVNWIRVSDEVDIVSQINRMPNSERPSYLVMRTDPVFESVAELMRPLNIPIILLLNNGLAPTDMKKAIELGVERFATRCTEEQNYNSFFPYNWRVHLVQCSVPFVPYLSTDKLAGSPVEGRVIWVGATKESKGFHHLLRAWPLVRKRASHAELHVYGSSILHDQLGMTGWTNVMASDFESAHLSQLAQSPQELADVGIVLHGSRPRAEIFLAARSAMVGVVNPNVRTGTETFCMSAVEIQAAGCPCVGGKAGGLLDTIDDGKSGTLVNGEKSEELADAILRFLLSADLREAAGRHAQIHAARFLNPASEAQALHKLFQQAVRGTPSLEATSRTLPFFIGLIGSLTISRIAARVHRTIARLLSC